MTKESLRGIDKRLILRETFNSESDVSNNGIFTNVVFSKGNGIFNGSSSFIGYGNFTGLANGGNATFDGNIPVTKVIQGIATTKQIENYYNSTKRYFGK